MMGIFSDESVLKKKYSKWYGNTFYSMGVYHLFFVE